MYNKPFDVDLEGGRCETKRKLDLRMLFNNTVLRTEIDGNQHKNHIKCDENIRCDNLFMDFSGEYISIRYNPGEFIVEYNTSKNPSFQTNGIIRR